MVVKSTLMAWILRRRNGKLDISSSLQDEFSDPSIISKDLNDSMAPISAWECQMDLSSSEICHSNKPTSQPREGPGRTLCVKLKRKQCHIKQLLYAWHFASSRNQIKRYQEIYLCDHVLKEWRKLAFCIIFANRLNGVLHTNSLGFAICKKSQVSLRDVRFATYAAFGPNESMPSEVVHGPSRREMQQLFQLVGKCNNCFSDILTKGLIESPYVYGVLMSVDKN
jgi:hypothetical protein